MVWCVLNLCDNLYIMLLSCLLFIVRVIFIVVVIVIVVVFVVVSVVIYGCCVVFDVIEGVWMCVV